ncbi:hypothetical protein [Dyella telluris]|uniref:Uncharacterized protein n=1 Tax=Dyella telluris TaxID=2763498 RepID=A0A7G8Q4I2_9GAMM|nr:hypothetical protein [Dyella telluris]QNK01690.1 hypothetical protein H8F01_00475 [Dyella telluris]
MTTFNVPIVGFRIQRDTACSLTTQEHATMKAFTVANVQDHDDFYNFAFMLIQERYVVHVIAAQHTMIDDQWIDSDETMYTLNVYDSMSEKSPDGLLDTRDLHAYCNSDDIEKERVACEMYESRDALAQRISELMLSLQRVQY